MAKGKSAAGAFCSTTEIDLHSLNVEEARKFLKQKLDSVSPDIREIVVIHGFYSGNALQNMVRKGFKHPKIKQKILTLNNGMTIFKL